MNYEKVIFVSIDTLRGDCVGANPCKLWPLKHARGSQPRTPLLDAMAERAAYFPNTISAAPYTSASHATIFTGKWPLRHGLYEFFNRRLGGDTVFTAAKRAGRRTVFKVDFPIILGRFLGFDRDIDEYLVEDDEAFLRAISAPGEMTGFLHFSGAHWPYGFHNLKFGGEDYIAKVRELEKEIDPNFPMPGDQLVETFLSKDDVDLVVRYKRVVQYLYESKNYDRLFELYLEGADNFMRRRFEPVMKRLLKELEGKRYLLVIFGDHGEEFDDDSTGHHNTLAEGVIRVPLMFYGPDVVPGTHKGRVRTVDVLPTLLDRLGVSGEEVSALDGASLAPTVWKGEAYPIRQAFSQTYVAEVADVLTFQKRVIATGEQGTGLPHVRYKEAVYDREHRLVRHTHSYSLVDGEWRLRRCPTRLVFETIGDDLVPREAPHDPKRIAELIELLDGYNTIQPEVCEPAAVTAAIRGDLQNMGYRI